MKYTTFYLTYVLVKITTVAVLQQCFAVKALTSTACAIPEPFTSRVTISGPECHARMHSYEMGVL